MNKTDLSKIKFFVLDMDGTIYLGDSLFPQTIPFLDAVKKSGRDFAFFTNNSSKNRNAYLNKLKGMGITVDEKRMFISSDVMTQWLLENHPDYSAYVVGTPDLEEAVRERGITTDSSDPDCILLGFDTTLTYEKLVKACDMVRAGKPIYGLNPDLNCPTETGFIPDCGSIARLVEASTGVLCDFFGKPSRHTLNYLLKETGCRPEELAIIGDRLYTDIALARDSQVTSILVLSGESTRNDAENSPFKPDLIFDDIGEIIKYL